MTEKLNIFFIIVDDMFFYNKLCTLPSFMTSCFLMLYECSLESMRKVEEKKMGSERVQEK